MAVQYGDYCMRRRKIYVWVERFKGEGKSATDDGRSGPPSTITCTDVKQQIDKHIRHNRSFHTHKTPLGMNISHGTTRCMISVKLKRTYSYEI
jgi:hypothetical protein